MYEEENNISLVKGKLEVDTVACSTDINPNLFVFLESKWLKIIFICLKNVYIIFILMKMLILQVYDVRHIIILLF